MADHLRFWAPDKTTTPRWSLAKGRQVGAPSAPRDYDDPIHIALPHAMRASSKSLDEAYNPVQIATGKINNDNIRLRKLREVRPKAVIPASRRTWRWYRGAEASGIFPELN
jgi:hypothetical protein